MEVLELIQAWHKAQVERGRDPDVVLALDELQIVDEDRQRLLGDAELGERRRDVEVGGRHARYDLDVERAPVGAAEGAVGDRVLGGLDEVEELSLR